MVKTTKTKSNKNGDKKTKKTTNGENKSKGIREYDLHCAIANYLDQRRPRIRYTSMPQGADVGGRTGNYLEKKGVKKFIPDIIILNKRGPFGVCLIELKRPGTLPKRQKNRFTDIENKNYLECEINSQLDMCVFLNQEGQYCDIIDDFDKAISTIEWYMQLKKSDKRPFMKQKDIKYYGYNNYKIVNKKIKKK